MKNTIKRYALIAFCAFVAPMLCAAQDSVRIFGRVTDFDQQPLDSVSVLLKGINFENIASALTGKDGKFSITAKRGMYYCIYAVKASDYAKTKLEYWAWNVPALSDLEINPQYDRMEIYSVNAFEPQVGPWDTYMVYFRPMSLTKALSGAGASKQGDTIDVAPSAISPAELSISINGSPSEVLSIAKVPEAARGSFIWGYMAQVRKPKESIAPPNRFDRITIVLRSTETGESGMGECFVERVR